jgi:hypothetical protein
MTKLSQCIDQLEKKIILHEKINLAVSQATIGWHIDHSLLVINGIVAQLKNSNPNQYKWRFNLSRFYIQTINKIPRGKGKAPKIVQPTETTSTDGLIAKLDLAKKNSHELESLDPKCYFAHPYFGNLNVKKSIWFLELHTKHHLKIIEDISLNP